MTNTLCDMKQNTEEELSAVITRRNLRLRAFLNHYIPKARIIGDPNSPAIILGNKCLACYVKNFDLIFTDAPFNGQELARVKLTKEIEAVEEQDLQEWIDGNFHRPAFRIQVLNTGLFLSGYNFLDKSDPKNPKDRYPVFSMFGEKIYFNIDYAQEVIDNIMDIELQVV